MMHWNRHFHRISWSIGFMAAVAGNMICLPKGVAQTPPPQPLDPQLNQPLEQPLEPQPGQPLEQQPGRSLDDSDGRSLQSSNYLLGVGDVIQVSVFNAPDYSAELRVLAGGAVNMPVLGPIPVGGMSLQQASTQIATRLSDYLHRPRVSISVLETRPLQVAVVGEVYRPGAYRITITEESGIPTLTQAIELAGGITQSANIRQIQVQRRQPVEADSELETGARAGTVAGVTSNADQPTTVVDLWQLLQTGQLEEDFVLQDGDRILIPRAENLSPSEVTELAAASFSPDQITVNVVGEVEAPGAIQVPPNTPLTQALLAAGGFNNRARRADVNLIRLNPDGTVTEREIEIDFAAGINAATNPSLQPNDTIVVRRSGISRVGDTVEALVSPFSDFFGILRIFN